VSFHHDSVRERLVALDVRDPGRVRVIDSELTLKPIRGDHGRHAYEMSRLLVATDCPDSMTSHDPGNSFPTDLLTGFSKIEKDSRTSVNSIASRVRLSDQLEQSLIFDRSFR
jgi:hypothetical protein